MKKENVFFSRQEFLNLPGKNSTAAIVAHIIQNEMNAEEDSQRVDVELHISDCIRTIDFDFEVNSDYNRENALYKLDTLIKVLTEFRTELTKVCKHQQRLEKKYKRRRLAELEKEEAEKAKSKIKLDSWKRAELNNLRKELQVV